MAYNQPYNYGYGYPQYQNGAVPDMLNQFKGQYQQPIMQQPMVQQMQTLAQTNDMIWVLNENEATSYPVGLNNSVVLWDKNNPTIYVKSVNANGIPSMRVLDFTERNADTSNSHENTPKTHKCTCGDKFATKDQINALESKIEGLEEKMEELTQPIIEKTTTKVRKTKESEE